MTDSISKEIVDQTWQEMAQMSEEEAAQLGAEMHAEQATLQNFWLHSGSGFTQDEREALFYLGVVVWRMMSQSQRRLGKVSKARLEQAGRKNADLLKMFAQDSDADFYTAVQTLLEQYPEPEVLRYIAEAILEESDDPQDPAFREEMKGPAFVQLKIGLDALIYSLWKSGM
jgi:hypothetical protein